MSTRWYERWGLISLIFTSKIHGLRPVWVSYHRFRLLWRVVNVSQTLATFFSKVLYILQSQVCDLMSFSYQPQTINFCTTPRKLDVYKPMGAKRAESCTMHCTVLQLRNILSSAHDVTISLGCILVWICAKLSRTKIVLLIKYALCVTYI